MDERPPDMESVAENALNKHSRTNDKKWFSRLGFGRIHYNSP
jgi:hypothetical protein